MLSVSFFFFLTVSKQSSLTSTLGSSSQRNQKVPQTQAETIQEALPSGSPPCELRGSDATFTRSLHYPYTRAPFIFPPTDFTFSEFYLLNYICWIIITFLFHTQRHICNCSFFNSLRFRVLSNFLEKACKDFSIKYDSPYQGGKDVGSFVFFKIKDTGVSTHIHTLFLDTPRLGTICLQSG